MSAFYGVLANFCSVALMYRIRHGPIEEQHKPLSVPTDGPPVQSSELRREEEICRGACHHIDVARRTIKPKERGPSPHLRCHHHFSMGTNSAGEGAGRSTEVQPQAPQVRSCERRGLIISYKVRSGRPKPQTEPCLNQRCSRMMCQLVG